MTVAVQREWILDRGAGWHARARRGVVDGPEGTLTLGALPGRADRIEWLADSPAIHPTALAGDPLAGLFVLDGDAHLVLRASVERPGASRVAHVRVLPTIGGEGSGLRHFREPRGIARMARGEIAVADTGNHRVLVFSRSPYALLHAWGARDALGQPAPGTRPLEFKHPWDMAFSADGTLFVADRGNHRIQRIRTDGAALEPCAVDASMDPTSIAVAEDGTLAVIDRARRAAWLFSAHRVFPQKLDGLETPSSVAFSPGGELFVGDESGRIHVFRSTGGAAPWLHTGSGVTGLDAAIERMSWWAETPARLLFTVRDEHNGLGLWSANPYGGRALGGQLIIGPLDSHIDRCQWHRVRCEGTVPAGCSIDVESTTFDKDGQPDPPPDDETYSGWTRDVLAGETNPDCLIQSATGRKLWLRLSLRSSGQDAPVITRIHISYPRSSYVQYLPAVYQEDDQSREFLDRFLSIFQSGFDDFDAAIDRMPQLFDPFATPERHLLWLASWLALTVDPEWLTGDTRMLREQIAHAVAAYRVRGTPDGLRDAIQTYARVDSRVVEHFRLTRWPSLTDTARLDGASPLWSRAVYQRLQLGSYSQVGTFQLTSQPEPALEPYAVNAHRFSVFFQTDPHALAETRARVEKVVEREKPGHTEASLCPVFPRFRVGVQATIGIDTVVGTISHAVLNQMATLNYDTILGCSLEEQALRAMGSAMRPAVGATTRVP
jgi:phage tail-like protein